VLRGNPFHRDYNDTLIRAVLLYKIEAAAKPAWPSRKCAKLHNLAR